MFGFRYQWTSLTLILFENDIFAIDVEFIFILKVEIILIIEYAINLDPVFEPTLYIDNLLKIAFFISISDIVYTIIVNII